VQNAHLLYELKPDSTIRKFRIVQKEGKRKIGTGTFSQYATARTVAFFATTNTKRSGFDELKRDIFC
jgi:hypothetical protein